MVNQVLLISLLPLPKLTTSTFSLWPKQSKPTSLVYIIWTSQIFCSKLFSPFGSGMCRTAGRNSSSSLLSRPSEFGTYRNGTPQEADSCLKSFGFAKLRTCCARRSAMDLYLHWRYPGRRCTPWAEFGAGVEQGRCAAGLGAAGQAWGGGEQLQAGWGVEHGWGGRSPAAWSWAGGGAVQRPSLLSIRSE